MSGPHADQLDQNLCAAVKGLRKLCHYGKQMTSKSTLESFLVTHGNLPMVFMFSARNRREGSQTCVVMTDPDFPQISQVQGLHCEDFNTIPLKLVAVGLGGFQEGHSCNQMAPT